MGRPATLAHSPRRWREWPNTWNCYHSHGPTRDNASRKHPCLVPYAELPDAEKEHDRLTSLQAIKAIIAFGYQIEMV